MSSLLNSKKYKSKIFKELYYKRWGVQLFSDEINEKTKGNKYKVNNNLSYCFLKDRVVSLFFSNNERRYNKGT